MLRPLTPPRGVRTPAEIGLPPLMTMGVLLEEGPTSVEVMLDEVREASEDAATVAAVG